MDVGYVNPKVKAMYGKSYSELTATEKAVLHADSERRAKLISERQEAVLKNNLKAFEDEAKMEKVLASIYSESQKTIIADVTETIAKVQKAGGEWSYANQSALTRSRGLFEQISEELTKLGQAEQQTFYESLSNIYSDQFMRQVYELGQSITVKANFNRLNTALIRKTLDYPWSGAMFSDRLWNDKVTLGRNLRLGLTQSMILGESIPEITERINKNINTSKYNAERVARTETKRVTYCAHDDVYEDMGVEELEYRCANGGDERTCQYCRADNGKHYKRGEEPTLPRHPNCRCVYIPVVSDEFGENELNELTDSVRGAENYDKWKEAEEEKIKASSKLTDKEKEYYAMLDEINASYDAKTNEISLLQADYDTLSKQYSSYSVVRRGLDTPQSAGFKSKAAFEAADKQLKADMESLQKKIAAAQVELKDLERDARYLQEVGVERAKTLTDYRSIRKALKSNDTFDYDKYADELVTLVARYDDEALAIQKSLSGVIKNNVYNGYSGEDCAHYSPYYKRVSMKMSANSHEAALGNGLDGSWQTKAHEEGHQLDHLLSAVSEITGSDSSTTAYTRAFTSTATATGKKIAASIEDDIVSFLNTAVSYCNSELGCEYKAVKNLTRISSDTRYAFDKYVCYLTSNGADRKASAQLGIFTDAIGLYTKDRLSRNTLSCSGWGHDSSYNKDRGVSGSTSETWATFCALRSYGSEEEIAAAKSYMPSTWSCLSSIYSSIAKYAKSKTLTY